MMPALLDRPAPIDDDATRRRFLAGALSLAALLAGCGSSPAAPPATVGSPGFPRTLDGKEGPTTIPAEPRRVVTVGFQRDTDTVLALGAVPLGITANTVYPSGVAPWVEEVLVDPRPEVLDVSSGLPFEAIAGLNPDLILATDDYELATNLPTLTGIAPTLSYLQGPESDTWQQRALHIGAALGRDEQARALVADLQAIIDRPRPRTPRSRGRRSPTATCSTTRSARLPGQMRRSGCSKNSA